MDGMGEVDGPFARWAQPEGRYRKLIAGNFRDLPEERLLSFGNGLAADSLAITDGELSALLAEDWRGRPTAAWLIGFARRSRFAPELRSALLAAGEPYAGKGYCFALARFGGAEDARTLEVYLDTYLRRPDASSDCGWAMGALSAVRARTGSPAGPSLTDSGLWRQWLADKQIADPDFLDRTKDLVLWLIDFADSSMLRVAPRGDGRP